MNVKFEDTEGMYIVVCSVCVCACVRACARACMHALGTHATPPQSARVSWENMLHFSGSLAIMKMSKNQ